MARSVTLLWCLVAFISCQHAVDARFSPHRAYAASTGAKAKPGSKQGAAWSIGDILIASHNDVGFPRVDVLDPNDLSVKDSVDLVPACGGQSKIRGLSFSPRFSTMKLQLAVSCAGQQSQGPDGKLVLLAAKQARHPVLDIIPVQQAGASVYNRTGEIFVLGLQQLQQEQQIPYVSVASVSKPSMTLKAEVVDVGGAHSNITAVGMQQGSTTPIATAGPQLQQPAKSNSTPATATHHAPLQISAVLYRLQTVASKGGAATAAAKQQAGQRTSAAVGITAVAANSTTRKAPEVAAVLPSAISNTRDISLDLGANGRNLYYTLGTKVLKTYDTVTGIYLPDRQLPSSSCRALLAQFDGTLLVACARCLYHLPASAAAEPIKHACFNMSAPFGQHIAMDPTGTHVLISAVDGSVHSIRVSDFTAVKNVTLPGRAIGGVAVLGTVLANQQDCTPGAACCPYGKILSKGTTCRKASTGCAEEAQCDGVSPECPTEHPVKTLGTICRHPRKPCEQQAICDGVSDKCPPNPVLANGTKCMNGRADNACAARGVCDGMSAECTVRAGQSNGDVCSWRPDDGLNIFRIDKIARIAALPAISPSLQSAAVGALRSLVRRKGRRPLAQQSMTSASYSNWGGRSSRASPLSVCQGQCLDSKCVMSVGKRGCCILPGSRLDDDAPSQPIDSKKKHRRRRGTEEDMYCWE